MKILFLGTGAADYNEKHREMIGYRRNSSALVDECILIDPGPCVLDAIASFCVDISKIKSVTGEGISEIKEDGETLLVSTIYDDAPGSVSFNDVLLERCENCKSKKHVAYDELLGEEGDVIESSRFDEVKKLEEISSDELLKEGTLVIPFSSHTGEGKIELLKEIFKYTNL